MIYYYFIVQSFIVVQQLQIIGADRQLAPGELAETRPGILPPTRPAPVGILQHKKIF